MGRVVGGANTLSKMPERFPGAYPTSLEEGKGARVWDSEGKSYTDWICGLGAISLGYGNAWVDHAVQRQVEDGPIFSLPNVALEEETAELLHDLIPCAEKVRFLKTGSEATEAAIRVARAYTGREVILQCGYHSWHSWYAATREHSPGVPLAMKGLVRSFKYNDYEALYEMLNGDAGSVEDGRLGEPLKDYVAAIIIEPTLFEEPKLGFLEALREAATQMGALLIFDEMVTGFRWHEGGYQSVCGVIPDLATFGKGMGNGYPIAALVGRADIMEHARLASGTFGGDCIGLAAARATMDRYAQGGVCEHMRRVGSELINGYNILANNILSDAQQAPTRMEGQPFHPRIVWDEVTDLDQGANYGHAAVNRYRASLFFQECVKRGVLFHPDGFNVSLAHDRTEVNEALNVSREAMRTVCVAIQEGTVRQQIIGEPISPGPVWRVTN